MLVEFIYENQYIVKAMVTYTKPNQYTDNDLDYFGGYNIDDVYVTDHLGNELPSEVIPSEEIIRQFEIQLENEQVGQYDEYDIDCKYGMHNVSKSWLDSDGDW
jgi:hypothetical protein